MKKKVKNKFKVSAIIEARMSSSRLPGKVMMPICQIPSIHYLINRLKFVNELDDIIVATTTNKNDDILVKYLKKMNLKYFRGSEENVLDRVYKTAKHFHVKIIAQITGDCPIIDPRLISQAINTYLNNKADYVSNSTIRSYPDGMDVAIFSTASLAKVRLNTKNKNDLEHVTLYYKKNPKKFKLLNILAPYEHHLPNLGLTLDEHDDYKLICKIADKLHSKKKPFTLDDILNFLEKNKHIMQINKNVRRKKVKL